MNILASIAVGVIIFHIILIWQGKITFDTKNNKGDRFVICCLVFSFAAVVSLVTGLTA